MKKIILNGPASDSVGNFVDAGGELSVSGRHQAGHIDEGSAKALIASGGAEVVRVQASPKPKAKPISGAGKEQAKSPSSPAPSPTPPKAADA
jgi:hypothetical protein